MATAVADSIETEPIESSATPESGLAEMSPSDAVSVAESFLSQPTAVAQPTEETQPPSEQSFVPSVDPPQDQYLPHAAPVSVPDTEQPAPIEQAPIESADEISTLAVPANEPGEISLDLQAEHFAVALPIESVSTPDVVAQVAAAAEQSVFAEQPLIQPTDQHFSLPSIAESIPISTLVPQSLTVGEQSAVDGSQTATGSTTLESQAQEALAAGLESATLVGESVASQTLSLTSAQKDLAREYLGTEYLSAEAPQAAQADQGFGAIEGSAKVEEQPTLAEKLENTNTPDLPFQELDNEGEEAEAADNPTLRFDLPEEEPLKEDSLKADPWVVGFVDQARGQSGVIGVQEDGSVLAQDTPQARKNGPHSEAGESFASGLRSIDLGQGIKLGVPYHLDAYLVQELHAVVSRILSGYAEAKQTPSQEMPDQSVKGAVQDWMGDKVNQGETSHLRGHAENKEKFAALVDQQAAE